MTGFEERYEIGDPVCGVIAYAPTKLEATKMLANYRYSHLDCDLYLYDRMAHRNQDDMWDNSGRVMHIKGE